MFTKIIKLENVKQWQHTGSKGGSENDFSKLNLIYGRNGAGKSTLTKILDLINKRDIAKIKKLAPLETEKEPLFNFMIKGNSITLATLDQAPEFHIFNQGFVDENLYSSNGVESSQLVNYYDFCLGKVSVDKQKQIDKLIGKQFSHAAAKWHRSCTYQITERHGLSACFQPPSQS